MPPRTPTDHRYDGSFYGRIVEPLIAGMHSVVVSKVPAGLRVLDACCGTGGMTRRLAETSTEVLGVDLSPKNIDFARSRLGDGEDNVRFEVRDVGALTDHADGSFDLATIVMAVHEMPPRCRVGVLRELGRVGRQVMVVDFAVPLPWNLAGVRNRLFEVMAGGEHFRNFRDFLRGGGLVPVVEEAGLRIVSQRTVDASSLALMTLEGVGAAAAGSDSHRPQPGLA